MSRSRQHSRESRVKAKWLARGSNAEYKRERAHRERTRLRNKLADISRFEDELDIEFVPWDNHKAKHVNTDWY